ncbi:putative phage associated protein [Neisseria gonorrhoeae]|uniref:Putative phage associated protein n=1 Tax=Neisseria gonorrhoeae TaxID=485 RepID=A0A378VYU5_NEIGO|nr:putative phage associated protein [Neisseria gonorrhoeae]
MPSERRPFQTAFLSNRKPSVNLQGVCNPDMAVCINLNIYVPQPCTSSAVACVEIRNRQSVFGRQRKSNEKNLPALALASMLILSGCDRLGIGNPFSGKEISCGSEETKEILVKLVRDNVEGETVKTFDDDAFKDQAFADIGISHIRRMVERLGITVDEVRTTEKPTRPANSNVKPR